jgi:ParB family chromosome partitioning protein
MAKGKQDMYLQSLLKPEADAAPDAGAAPEASTHQEQPESPALQAERPRGGMTLLGRQSALARVASGDVKQVARLMLDPARARIWPGNPRYYDQLTEENTRELIDSIIAEGGQRIPVVARRLKDNPDFDHEIIIGSRRHFAVSWLRQNNYPEFKLLADVADLDDESAFRLADLENRARKDISVIERARSYAQAYKTHYGSRAVRMAERLKVSKGWLSKMLKVAALPDAVLAAFGSTSDVQLKSSYDLAMALDDDDQAARVLDIAKSLALEQARRRDDGLPAIPANQVIKQLMARDDGDAQRGPAFVFQSKLGRDALSVLTSNRQGVTIRLHPGSGADRHELTKALHEALLHLEKQGQGLAR